MMATTKTSRIKKTPPAPPATREEMEALVGEIAALTITQREQMAQMDGRLQMVRAEYESGLAELRLMLDDKMERARLWAVTNPEAFGTKRSIDMVHGAVGFRTGMPRLKTLRGITWALVLELLAKYRLTEYVRLKTEPDKDRIIADREKLGERLRDVGLECVQDESFYIEPKMESIPEVAH